jgi:parvulin-like peptidyl-prolyl isomerase
MHSDMRRRIAVFFLFTVLSVTRLSSVAGAETIDRIMAVVNGRIITLSDLRKEREIMAVLGDPAGTDDELVKTLVDRFLLEEQIAQFPGLDVSDDEVTERVKMITDLHGLDAAEIRDAIALKIQRRKYFDLRYRQFVLVSNEEIRNYYETVFTLEARKQGVAIPELGQIENEIRENVFEEKLSREVESSLESLRSRSNVEIL